MKENGETTKERERASWYIRQGIFMKGSGWAIKPMGTVGSSQKAVIRTKEGGWMIRRKGKDRSITKMELSIRDRFIRVKNVGLVGWKTQMAATILGNSWTTSFMAKVSMYGPTKGIREIGSIQRYLFLEFRCTAKDFASGKTAGSMLDNTSEERSTVMESSAGRTADALRGNGGTVSASKELSSTLTVQPN